MQTNKLIRVLVVSADEGLLFLKKAGYQCIFVQNEHQAFSVLKSNPFDALVLNWPANGLFLPNTALELQQIGVIVISALAEGGPDIPNFVDKVIVLPNSFNYLLETIEEIAGQYVKNN